MPWQFPKNKLQTIVVSIIALWSATAVVLLQLPQLQTLRNKTQAPTASALQKELKLEKLRLNLLEKVPAFGFDNLLSDWVFLNFLQYFGDNQVRSQTGYALSPNYFQIIIERDPRFLEAYLPLSTSISMYAAQPEQSVALMEKGLKSLSPQTPDKSYYVWRYKGIDELLFLGDGQAAQQSFEKAAEWASTYSDQESQSIAAISSQTAEFLKSNPESKAAQISAWAMVLGNATDQRTQQIAISQIEALGGKVIITPEGELRLQLPATD